MSGGENFISGWETASESGSRSPFLSWATARLPTRLSHPHSLAAGLTASQSSLGEVRRSLPAHWAERERGSLSLHRCKCS